MQNEHVGGNRCEQEVALAVPTSSGIMNHLQAHAGHSGLWQQAAGDDHLPWTRLRLDLRQHLQETALAPGWGKRALRAVINRPTPAGQPDRRAGTPAGRCLASRHRQPAWATAQPDAPPPAPQDGAAHGILHSQGACPAQPRRPPERQRRQACSRAVKWQQVHRHEGLACQEKGKVKVTPRALRGPLRAGRASGPGSTARLRTGGSSGMASDGSCHGATAVRS